MGEVDRIASFIVLQVSLSFIVVGKIGHDALSWPNLVSRPQVVLSAESLFFIIAQHSNDAPSAMTSCEFPPV